MTETGTPAFQCRKLLPSKLCFHVCLFVCCCCCFFFFLDQFSEKLHSILFMLCAFHLVFRWGCIFPSRNCIDCIFPNWVIIIINLGFGGGAIPSVTKRSSLVCHRGSSINCILCNIATSNFYLIPSSVYLCLHLHVTDNSCQVWLCTKTSAKALTSVVHDH